MQKDNGIQRKQLVGTQREDCYLKSRTEPSEVTNPTKTLSSASKFQNCETIKFYCLKSPSLCTLLWQLWETNTLSVLTHPLISSSSSSATFTSQIFLKSDPSSPFLHSFLRFKMSLLFSNRSSCLQPWHFQIYPPQICQRVLIKIQTRLHPSSLVISRLPIICRTKAKFLHLAHKLCSDLADIL